MRTAYRTHVRIRKQTVQLANMPSDIGWSVDGRFDRWMNLFVGTLLFAAVCGLVALQAWPPF